MRELFLTLMCLFAAIASTGAGKAEYGLYCEAVVEQLQEAEQAINDGHLEEAEESLRNLHQENPRCQRPLLGLGRIAAERNQHNEAIEKLTQYKNARPTDADGYYYLAQVFLKQGNYPRVDVMSELAVMFGPEHARALTLRAKILGMKGQLDQAEEMLNRAAGLDPDNAQIFLELGMLMDRRKKNAEAVAAFERVLQLNPENPSAYDYLALNLEPLGEIERAEEAYRKGLEVNSGSLFDRFLDYNYGRFLMKQNRLDEAKKHLDRALKLAPETRAVHYEHGKLMLNMSDPAAAVEDLEKAAGIADPGQFILDIQIYYLLSQAYVRLGEKELAEKYAELSRQARVPLQGRARQ